MYIVYNPGVACRGNEKTRRKKISLVVNFVYFLTELVEIIINYLVVIRRRRQNIIYIYTYKYYMQRDNNNII